MASNEPLTLVTFKKKLREGGYKNLAGARRAVGKVANWTDEEREKGRAAAANFFGEEPAKPAAKKKSKKKTTKKAAKKVAAKAPTKKAAAKKAVKKTVGRARAQRAAADLPIMAQLKEIGLRIGTTQQALDAMRVAKELGAAATQVQEGAKAAQKVLTASVNELCQLTTDAVEEAIGGNGANMDLLGKAADAATAGPTPPTSLDPQTTMPGV